MTIDIATVLREHDDIRWSPERGTADREGSFECVCGEAITSRPLSAAFAEHQAEMVMAHLRENGREEEAYRRPQGAEDESLYRRYVIETDWEEA